MAKAKFTIQPVKITKPIEGIDRELLTKTVDDGVYPLAMAKEIRLDRLRPDPDQPRRTFDQHRLEELASSIREHGILQPLVVEYVDEGDYFRIVHGERRWRASVLIGLQTVPAIVHQSDDSSRLARQLIENIQREDLNDVDRALALKQLKVNLGSPSWDVVAQKVGISKRRVLQLMATTKLPEPIQQDIRSGQLTEKHGRAIKKLPPDQQIDFANVIREQGLSGDESLELVKIVTTAPEIPITEAVAQIKQSIPPLPKATEAEEAQSVPTIPLAPDPLADLVQVSQSLERLDITMVDVNRLRTMLREIIAKAQAILARVPEDIATSDSAVENPIDDKRPGPQPPSEPGNAFH